jgi:hypothetical protein
LSELGQYRRADVAGRRTARVIFLPDFCRSAEVRLVALHAQAACQKWGAPADGLPETLSVARLKNTLEDR